MKIIAPALSEELLSECEDSFFEHSDKRVWISSDTYWEKPLIRNVSGVCNITDVPEELRLKIEKEIKHHLPEYNYLIVTFSIWHRHSGICFHSDDNNLFGVTIYLDRIWDPEWGGVFMWYEKNDTDNPQVFFPKRNYIIINDEHEYHMVSEVSSFAKTVRKTIQIFGK